jgi:hypothetical protein
MYQIVWLGEKDWDEVEELSKALKAGMRDLGVDPAVFLKIFDNADALEWRYPVVAVWFAGDDPPKHGDTAALGQLLGEGCVVFPVVEDLADFERLVPTSLQEINGFEWRIDSSRLAGEILRACGLTREQRSAFISYRRSHSRTTAVQLFHQLSDHGYRVFLDTASVDYGVKFQETLWDRMSDADLLLFLDTPGALSSRWVEVELTRANNLGLGILQVVWPGWLPFSGTELSTRFLLNDKDFKDASPPYLSGSPKLPNPEGYLVEEALNTLVQTAERVRMRSLGSRRDRIIGEIVDRATRRGLRVGVNPGGLVTLTETESGTRTKPARNGKVMIVVGLPSAESVFNSSSNLAPGGVTVRLVYDGLGISPRKRSLLDWLNQQVPNYQSLPVDAVDEWLDGL